MDLNPIFFITKLQVCLLNFTLQVQCADFKYYVTYFKFSKTYSLPVGKLKITILLNSLALSRFTTLLVT